MYSWTETFGRFITDEPSWKADREIVITSRPDSGIGEYMVEAAIKLCKRYGMELTGAVEYRETDTFNRRFSFKARCSARTYKSVYEGGHRYHPGPVDPQVREKDRLLYEEKFGTRVCRDEMFRKRFYFTDNWDGHLCEYPSLEEAEAAAHRQYGVSVSISTNHPYGQMSSIVKFEKASGTILP